MDDGRRRPDRKSVGLLVKLNHPDLGTFVEAFATNISAGGMFIRSRKPHPVGTDVRFQVEIAGGLRVMRGTAVVQWSRGEKDPAGPPGMGLQFKEVDEQTQALIDRMLASTSSAPAPKAAAAPAAKSAAAPAKPKAAAPAQAKAKTPTKPALEDEPLLPLDNPPPPEIPAPSPDDVNITIDDLIKGTPATPAKPKPREPDPVPPVEIELEGPDSSAGPMSGGVELNLEGADEPLELDFSGRDKFGPGKKEHPVQAAQAKAKPKVPEKPAAKPAPEKPAPKPAAPAAKPAPAPAPAAKAGAPKIATPPEGLPKVRRDAPSGAPSAPVVLDAPKPPMTAPEGPVTPGQPVFLRPPETLAGTGVVIGIDLGTTNSCVAVLNGTRPVVLRSREGYNTLPSVVSLTNAKKLLVSHRAKGQMVLNPQQTIYGAKRLVGRLYDSATVRQVRERFHYDIVADEGGKAAVRLGEHVLTLEEIQGLILRECKEMAEQQLNQKVERAVITVPAYYSEPQREAVRKSGAMAGLKVERILNEPTAAALAYGLNRELKKRVLVYDLGGGTFDATILRIDKNVFEVLATGGDIFLGGLDFDNQIVDYLLHRFQEEERITFSGDSVALSRVTDAAERTKVALSERNSFDVHIPMLMMDDSGKPRDMRCTIKREEIDDICGPLVNRTIDVVRDVLLDAKLKPADVDEIILVGGQSRMPLVREKIKELFGKGPHASVNADEAVALGAALYSGSVDKVSSVVLIDVLPMTIGVAMPGGAFKRVIERNTALPVQKSFGLATSRDNETTLELSLFQGEDNLVSSNEYLGTVRVEDLPKGPKGHVKLAVTLKVDSECVLHVEARELSTRKEVRATLATRYTPEALNQKLNISQAAIQAAEAKRGQELKERGGRFWGFLKKVLRR